MLLFAILQLLAAHASMLLPVAVIGLVTFPLALVNVLTIDASRPSTSILSLDSVEAVMCSRQMENGLYLASAFVHPMAGEVLKNIVLPYVCGPLEGLVLPTSPGNKEVPVNDNPRRNASWVVTPMASKHFQKYAAKGVSHQIHPAFVTLGLGLGVHASYSHVSPLPLPSDIQFARGSRKSARLSPLDSHSDSLHPLYTSFLPPPTSSEGWLSIGSLLRATAFLALILIAPFLDAPLARLECKMGLHSNRRPHRPRPPPCVVLDLLIPSDGEPWSMLATPEPLANRSNVYTCMEGMSNMQPIYRKTEPSPDEYFLFVNRDLDTNLVFAGKMLPMLLQPAAVIPTAMASSQMHKPRRISLPCARSLGLIRRLPASGLLLPPPPSHDQSVLVRKIFFHISAVQLPVLAYLGSFNSSLPSMISCAIRPSVILLPKSCILSRDAHPYNSHDIQVPDKVYSSTPEDNAGRRDAAAEKMAEAQKAKAHFSIPIQVITGTDEVNGYNTASVNGGYTVNNTPGLVVPTTALSTSRRVHKPKVTSLLKRERRRRFFELWLRVGLDKKASTVKPEAIATAASDEEDDDDEVFDYMSPTGLRRKSLAPTSQLNGTSSARNQDEDKHDDRNDGDDDEVFDYLSPTGLRQITPTHGQSLVSLNDSTSSCSSHGPNSLGKANVSGNTTISLSRSESVETIHVLDVGGEKGYDTLALFDDDSDAITVSLSSSSTLNQLSRSVSPSKAGRDPFCEVPESSTVVRLPSGPSSSGPIRDFAELFMSIYCRSQSGDRSLWSSIHAPGKADQATWC